MAMPSSAEIKAAFQNAPEYLKEFIRSEELYDTFQGMLQRHNLHIDQAGNLAEALNTIILGLRKLDEFPVLLKEALGNASDMTLKGITEEANEKIFSLLRTLTKEQTTTPAAAPKPLSAPAAVSSPIQSVQKAPLVTQLEPMPAPMPVAETKMTMTSAPAPVTTAVPMPPPSPTTAITPPTPKEVKPEAPVKYHGSDPYREPFE